MSLAVYVYSDLNKNQLRIDSNDYNYAGTWSSTGTYVAATLDCVVYSNARYICLVNNTGVNPTYIPPRNQVRKWSELSKIQQGDEPPFPPSDTTIGMVALETAWVGTALAQEAYNLALTGTNPTTNPALTAAQALDLAEVALETAWTGTSEAAGAVGLANQALQTAWTGTSSAQSATSLGQAAYNLAAIGTNVGTNAYNLATSGSNLAQQAYVLALQAGSSAGTTTADNVTYGRAGYNTVGDALDALFYVAPAVTSFTNDIGTVEKGNTVTTINLAWAYNKAVVSQSINQGIGSLPAAQRAQVVNGSFSSSLTFNLTASDGVNTANGSTSVNFQQKRYWGTSSLTSLTDGQIIALNKEFATSRAQTRIFLPSNEYIYFAYPTSFGSASFTVNGLPNTDWVLVQRAFVNSSGFSESYNIYRSTNLLASSFTVVVS